MLSFGAPHDSPKKFAAGTHARGAKKGTTMKRYQSQLPQSRSFRPLTRPPSPRPVPPTPRDDMADEMKRKLGTLFAEGFYFCLDGQHPCERIESDQGQPPKCSRCGSFRLQFNPPMVEAL